MRYDQRPEPGTVVYLAPVTRLAGRLEHAMGPVRVVAYEWPYVIVDTKLDVPLPGHERTDDPEHHRVFHQNLLLHPPKRVGSGDQAQSEERRLPRPYGERLRKIDIPSNEEQGGLW